MNTGEFLRKPPVGAIVFLGFIATSTACSSEVTEPPDTLALEAISPLNVFGTVASVASSAPTVRVVDDRGAPPERVGSPSMAPRYASTTMTIFSAG